MIKTELEKLQDAAKIAKSNLDGLKVQFDQAEQAVMDNPTNGDMALKASQLELQIRAAKKAVNRTQESLKTEQDRLTGPEAQEAIKQLEKINKEGVKLTADITKAAEALHGQMERWEALQKDARRIARQYNQDPFDLGIAGSRLWTVKTSIGRWMQEIRSWKRNIEIMAMPDHGMKSSKRPDTPERRRMLKKRYPISNER